MKYSLIAIAILSACCVCAQSPFDRVRSALETDDRVKCRRILDSCYAAGYHKDSVMYYRSLQSIMHGELREARKNISMLKKTNPDFYMRYYLNGLVSFSKQKFGKSIDRFTEALQHDPHHTKILYNRALAFGMIEDYRSAIRDLDSCIAISGNYFSAYYARAYWHEYLQNYSNAVADYEKVVAAEPDNFDAYFGLAYSLHMLKRNESACEVIGKAISQGSQMAIELKENFCR